MKTNTTNTTTKVTTLAKAILKSKFFVLASTLTAIAFLALCSNQRTIDEYKDDPSKAAPLDLVDFPIATIPAGGIAFPLTKSPPAYNVANNTGFDTETGKIEKAFKIGKTEVTYELYVLVRNWARSNGYTLTDGAKGSGNAGDNSQPVTQMSWANAVVFCNALTEWYNAKKKPTSEANLTIVYKNTSNQTLKIPALAQTPNFDTNATGFRLPTRAEWEFVARYIGTTKPQDVKVIPPGTPEGAAYQNYLEKESDGTKYYFTKGRSASGAKNFGMIGICCGGGSGPADEVAWYANNATSRTHNVATKQENALGLYDLTGNVNEWVFDSSTSDTAKRILKGASIHQMYDSSLIAFEKEYEWNNLSDSAVNNSTGLRVVRNK